MFERDLQMQLDIVETIRNIEMKDQLMITKERAIDKVVSIILKIMEIFINSNLKEEIINIKRKITDIMININIDMNRSIILG